MFEENKIKNDLVNLPFRKKLVFAASCCERLLPFYFAFFKNENWGNPIFLRSALDKIWEMAQTEQLSNGEIAELYNQCLLLVPDSEDFTSAYTSQAQNASSAICYTFEFCQNKEISFLGFVARVSFEAVEMYVNIVNDPTLNSHPADSYFDKWTQTAPLLLAEIKKQNDDIEFISSNIEITTELIKQIRDSSANLSINPEKRGLL